MAAVPTKTTAPATAPTGYYTEGKVNAQGVNVGGGTFVQGAPPASYNTAVQNTLSGTGVSYNPSTGGGSSVAPTTSTTPTSPSTAPVAPTPTGTINPINTNQPSTAKTQINPSNGSIVDTLAANGAPSSFADRNKMAAENGIPNYTGSADQNTQLLQKYKQGLASVQASGIPAPDNGGKASAIVAQNLQKPNDTSGADLALQNDKGYQQLLQDKKEYDTVINQKKSLTETYTQLTKEAGIPALNTELMNMKNVIEGGEDDIRNEITKAGGFATESQVLALTSSRNKQLIKNYNNLLETKNQAMSNVNTMIGLAEKDQTYTLQSITQKMQIDQQIASYAEKFVTNAKDAYQKIADKVGYDGLAKMIQATGDPQGISRVEQTLGLPAGGLIQLANLPPTLDTQIKQANLANINSEIAKRNSDIAGANAADASVNPDVLQGMLNIYKSTGVLPAFGLSAKSPLRAQFYAALGADGGIVTDANTNKAIRAGLTTSYKTQQNQLAANQTAIGTLDKQLELVQKYSDQVNRTNSPLINKYLIGLRAGVFGDPDTAALNNIVKTASYEFAKILSGSAASISGVTVTSAADAESMLNSAMSKGQFTTVLGLMKQESNFRLKSQQETLDNIEKDLNDVGSLSKSLQPIPPADIPNGYYQASDGLLYKK